MLFTESASLSRSKKALERAIARDEEAIRQAIGDIEQVVRQQLSVSERIRRKPAQVMITAFFGGVVLGLTLFGLPAAERS